jgi:hypothetical protein
MNRVLRLGALAAALSIAAPLSPALAKDADTYAMLHASEPPVADGMGRVYFYRDGGFMGAAVQPLIYVDGTAGGRSKPGDYFYVDLPAGSHKVSTDTETEEAIGIDVVAGQTLYVKTHVTMGLFVGHVMPDVVDNATAESEIQDCDYHPLTPAPVFAAPATAPATTPQPETAPAAAATPAETPTPAASGSSSTPPAGGSPN